MGVVLRELSIRTAPDCVPQYPELPGGGPYESALASQGSYVKQHPGTTGRYLGASPGFGSSTFG